MYLILKYLAALVLCTYQLHIVTSWILELLNAYFWVTAQLKKDANVITPCWRNYMFSGMFDFLKTPYFAAGNRGRPYPISFLCLVLKILTNFHLLSLVLILLFSFLTNRLSFTLHLILEILLLADKISFRLHLFSVMLLFLSLILAIPNLIIPTYTNWHVLLMFYQLL